MKTERKIEMFGHEFPIHALQRLYRERYLKISQLQFCDLTGVKQPHLSAHEAGIPGKWLNSICRAYDSCGFARWLGYVATTPDEAEMLADLLDPDSGLQWLSGPQAEKLGLDTSSLVG